MTDSTHVVVPREPVSDVLDSALEILPLVLEAREAEIGTEDEVLRDLIDRIREQVAAPAPPDPSPDGGEVEAARRQERDRLARLYQEQARQLNLDDGDRVRAMLVAARIEGEQVAEARASALAAENERLRERVAALEEVSCDSGRPLPMDRDTLGRMVREAWVRWAKTQPDPKPSWLAPYDELDEADKEADRQIGEAVARWTLIHDAARTALQGEDGGGR